MEENREFTIRSIMDDIRSQNTCRVFLYNSALICLYGSDTPMENWAEQAPQLSQLMEEANLQAGVSRRIVRMDQLVTYYQQAQSALELGTWLQRPYTFTHYDTLSSFLIFHRINSDDLELFVHQKIQALFTTTRTTTPSSAPPSRSIWSRPKAWPRPQKSCSSTATPSAIASASVPSSSTAIWRTATRSLPLSCPCGFWSTGKDTAPLGSGI